MEQWQDMANEVKQNISQGMISYYRQRQRQHYYLPGRM
jgi:hypothetical protein